jgi:L-rhamnonate dehydratase
MRARIAEIEVERIEESLWGGFWDIQRSASSSSPMSRYTEYASTLSSWSWPQAVVLVRIKTDAGESGLGWAEDGVAAASNIIQRHLKGFLLGADPTQIERLWDQMFRASIPYGRKGAAIQAISAVDLALWDLAGKRLINRFTVC